VSGLSQGDRRAIASAVNRSDNIQRKQANLTRSISAGEIFVFAIVSPPMLNQC
jgi:hypothetical protein